jgi:folate-binding protein YgfZ
VTEPFAAWIERDVIRVHGDDAIDFLQGQLSQDVATLAQGESRWSLLLAPTGKVDAWLRVTRAGDDDMILDTDAGWADSVITRLNRFKLRTKCDLEPVTGWRCVAIRGTIVDDPRALPIVWPGVQGVDLLGPDVDVPSGIAVDDRYERTRIAAGVPAMGRELTESTIPVEAGEWLIDASVSFVKGCFTGQELVARIDARGGNAPRPVRGLRIEGTVGVGAAVTTSDGRTVGTLTSAIDEGEATIALAPLSRAIEPGAHVLADGTTALVVELPMQ